MAARYSGTLADIFAADQRRRRGEPSALEQKKLEAAQARAKKGAEGGQWGGAIGTGLGALSLLTPATAPLAPALMGLGRAAGKAIGRNVAGGEAGVTGGDVLGIASSLTDLPTGSKDWDKLEGLIQAWKYPSKEK